MWAWLSSPEGALFLLVWLACGVLVNSGNLDEFNLQQIGVESIVERGHFYLEGSAAPELYPRADVFLRDGHKYAAKQPGQFMAGALAYFLLRLFGFSYVRNYLLTSAAVTFLTASLATAAAAVAVHKSARVFTNDGASPLWPLAAALCYALTTTALAYSGVAHHDTIATAYLAWAFHFVLRLSRGDEARRGGARLESFGAGALLGLTLTTSMLPLPMVVLVGAWFVSLRRWSLVPFFVAGGVAGLLPLFVYDAVSFGNPLLLPNVVGNYGDTFPRFDATNFAAKLRFYARMVVAYTPVVIVGLAGLALFAREHRRACLLIILMTAALALYVTNIGTTGDCQYGPRYLLPAAPFACLGLVGFARLRPGASKTAALALVAAAALFGLAVNLAGAMHGAMYCPVEHYAFPRYLSAIARGNLRAFPLAPWLLAPLAASAWLFARAASDSLKGRGAAAHQYRER